ncbi:hypothetical protein EV421DRAFT_1909902 [Armillaria borealis]|uniref:DUF6533 domain-containing protein n=1 Tax=Armillaria borealis TaxID=47425 RepID=A0AA39MGR7_9AGAR|nr:hypothetical protein EV421DRAFT_1909902 [Armillaria borealis]
MARCSGPVRPKRREQIQEWAFQGDYYFWTSSDSFSFYSFIASLTVLVYDLLLLLPTEIDYVWLPRPVHPLLPLFVLNRYLPLVDVVISINGLSHKPTAAHCRQLFYITGPLGVLSIFASQAILMIRTYAIWDRHRVVFWCFIGTATFCFIPVIVYLGIMLKTSRFVEPFDHTDCLSHSSNMPNILYIPVLVSETIIASFTLFKGVQHLRRSHDAFVKEFYVSGMFFYACLLLITLANILVPMWAHNVAPFLAFFQSILHSILSNRIMLLILTQKRTRRRYSTEELTSDCLLSRSNL